MARTPADLRRRRDHLIRQAGRGATPRDVFADASDRLRGLVPFDAAAWIGTDPCTGLPASPVHIDGLDGVSRAVCSEHWHDELLVDDVNLFRDLARADVPAASLRAATREPGRSQRYRRFLRPLGLDDELRAVLRAGDTPWGTLTLWRGEGSPPFTAAETATIAWLCEPLADALRRHARPADTRGTASVAPDGPGLLVLDPEGEVVSVNDAARRWLADLPPEPGRASRLGIEIPVWMLITVFRARALWGGDVDGTARTQVRTREGRWLVCHASCLRRPGDDVGETAVVLEAAQPAAVAPIVVEAYGLTPREQDVLARIARGTSTEQIAEDLLLSRHTIRDHVKALFAKVGVSSRGELVATVFAEYYEPAHAAGTVETGA